MRFGCEGKTSCVGETCASISLFMNKRLLPVMYFKCESRTRCADETYVTSSFPPAFYFLINAHEYQLRQWKLRNSLIASLILSFTKHQNLENLKYATRYVFWMRRQNPLPQ
jgi:hypothetical protein